MIGETIHSRSSVPVPGIFFLTVGAVCAACRLVESDMDFLIASALPFLLGLTLLLNRQPKFEAVITNDYLEVLEPVEQHIHYDDIEGLSTSTLDVEQESFGLDISCSGTGLYVPGNLSVPSWQLHRFLLEQIPTTLTRRPSEGLVGYHEHELQTFGPAKVHTWQARANRAQHKPQRIWGSITLSLLLVSGFWFLLGGFLQMEQWLGLGLVSFLAGMICLAVWSVRKKRSIGGSVNNWKRSTLVVGPRGLALIQGSLNGEMEWDDLQGLRLHRTAAKGTFIELNFGDTQAGIFDIYDRPLRIIYRIMRKYWEGGT